MKRFLFAAMVLVAPTAHAAVAYLSNEKGGVDVIDLDTMKIAKEFAVDGGPRGIGVTDDGAYILTANKTTNDVAVIDAKTGAVVHRIAIGIGPEFVRIRGDFAYVTYEPSGGGPPPAAGAKGIADISAAKGKRDDDKVMAEIAMIDLKTWKVIRSIKGGLETEGVEFSPDGKYVITANEGDETITVYDTKTGAKVKTVDTRSLGLRPRGIKLAPDGKHYVATLEGSSTLVLLDDKFNVVKSVPTKTGPYGVAFDPSGKYLIVAAARANMLQMFDATTLAPLKEAAVGMRCWHFAFTPDGSKILSACGRSNDVRVIDAKTFAPVATIDGAKLPWGIVTYPKGAGSLE